MTEQIKNARQAIAEQRIYPLPFCYAGPDLGKDMAVFGTPWEIRAIPQKRQESGKLKPHHTREQFGIYAGDICIAALVKERDVLVAEWVVAAMNTVTALRPAWDLSSAEQIKPISDHMRGLLAAYRQFMKFTYPEVKRAQSVLRFASAWVEKLGDFDQAASRHQPPSLRDTPFGDSWHYGVFRNSDHSAKTASRIFCRNLGGQERNLLIMMGYDDNCPQAKKLHGEIVVATVQAFLDINPTDPKIAWKFLVAAHAIRNNLPDFMREIHTLEITPCSRPAYFGLLGAVKMHCSALVEHFAFLDFPGDEVEPALWLNQQDRIEYYARHRAMVSQVQQTAESMMQAERDAGRKFGVRKSQPVPS